MNLERPDVKFRLDPDIKTALDAICDAKGLTLAEFCESIIVPVIREQVHVATVIAQRTAGLGISGNSRESTGSTPK